VGIQQHQLIFELSKQHSGYVAETSIQGKIWAEGMLVNGLAEGLWKYYALSGELQIAGKYSQGVAVGKWQTFYHTKDQNYTVFLAIQAGDLKQQSSAYHFIRLDSSETAPFRFRITYAVEKDSIQESYYYNKALLSKEIEYVKGLKEGKELSYDTHGNICKEYHFENDQLEGAFWVLQYDQLDPRKYIKIMGTYKADHKITEKHLFYQNKELIKVVSVLKRNRFQK
jgi:antitoxin component YwqK of YwqJK toxin-antitoxin module